MPKPTVIVDRIQSLDRPDHPLAIAPGADIPGHVVVHLVGGASLLDLHDPRAAIWEGLLDELRQAREPVYLETDPNTHVIQQLLYPRSVMVTHVATAPVGNHHEVEWETSHGRHHLDTANPDYPQLLEALTTAWQQGTPVLVTEAVDDQQIIDVRPDPAPFAGGPATLALPSVGPLDDAALAAMAVTRNGPASCSAWWQARPTSPSPTPTTAVGGRPTRWPG